MCSNYNSDDVGVQVNDNTENQLNFDMPDEEFSNDSSAVEFQVDVVPTEKSGEQRR